MTKSKWRMAIASHDAPIGLAKAQESLASLEDWVISCSDLANVGHIAPRPRPPRPILAIVVERWAVSATDPNVRAICDRVEKVCARLPAGSIDVLLHAAELVAQAEADKGGWNPKLKKEQFLSIARSIVETARLLNRLKRTYPPGWTTGELAASLAGFIRGAVNGGLPRVNASRGRAQTAVKSVKARPPRLVIPWDLIRNLVWLASHERIYVDEATVRRYAGKYKRAIVPGHLYLEQHSKDILDAVRNVPPSALQSRVQSETEQRTRHLLEP